MMNYIEKKIEESKSDHLSDCKWNLIQFKTGQNNFSGCPTDFGLKEIDSLCTLIDPEDEKEKKQQCKDCWEKVISEV